MKASRQNCSHTYVGSVKQYRDVSRDVYRLIGLLMLIRIRAMLPAHIQPVDTIFTAQDKRI